MTDQSQPGPSAAGLVSSAFCAQAWDCDEKTVRNLAERGIVIKQGRGKYVFLQSNRNYIRHLREMAAGRGSEEKQQTLSSERARVAREQADNMALRNSILRGDMIETASVNRVWGGALANIRARMLAVVSIVTQLLPHLTRADLDIIDRAIRDALTDAADDLGE